MCQLYIYSLNLMFTSRSFTSCSAYNTPSIQTKNSPSNALTYVTVITSEVEAQQPNKVHFLQLTHFHSTISSIKSISHDPRGLSHTLFIEAPDLLVGDIFWTAADKQQTSSITHSRPGECTSSLFFPLFHRASAWAESKGWKKNSTPLTELQRNSSLYIRNAL